MLQPAARDQHAGLDQRLDDRFVGIALFTFVIDDALAGEARRRLRKSAILVDRVRNGRIDPAVLQFASVCSPDFEVVAAMSGRSMHKAGSVFVGYMIAGKQRHRKIITALAFQRMITSHAGEHARVDGAHLFKSVDARLLENGFSKFVGENEEIARLHPVVGRRVNNLIKTIGNLRRKTDRAIAGQCPRRRRPDCNGCVAHKFEGNRDIALIVAFQRNIRDRKLHPNLIAGVVLVLDLGFRQRGFFDHAPHHRFRTAVQRSVGGKLHQLAGDLRLGKKIHRRIGMRPVALDAEPLEFLALYIEPVFGVGPAFLPKGNHRRRIGKIRLCFVLRSVVLFFDFPFDREAVAVPSRDIVRIVAEHLLAARDDILQNLIEGVPDMDIAIGVGRTVMQDEFVAAFRGRAELPVQIALFPASQDLRLALRQARTHGKFGLRQKQRFGIVALGLRHGGLCSRAAS